MLTPECVKLIVVWLAGAVGSKSFHRSVRTITANEQEDRSTGALRRARQRWSHNTGQPPERFGMGVPIAPLRPLQFVDAIWWATERGCGLRIFARPGLRATGGRNVSWTTPGALCGLRNSTTFNAVTIYSAWRWISRGATGAFRSTLR